MINTKQKFILIITILALIGVIVWSYDYMTKIDINHIPEQTMPKQGMPESWRLEEYQEPEELMELPSSVLPEVIWSKYVNDELGFSIDIPDRMYSGYECASGDFVPVKVFEDNDNNIVYINDEYYYDENCKKTLHSLESFTKKDEDRESYLEKAGFPSLLRTWALLIKTVKNEDELDKFIKENYGSGCHAVDKKFWEMDYKQSGVYDISIGGESDNQETTLGTTSCVGAWTMRHKVLYFPEKNKVMAVNLGADCNFGTNPHTPPYECYDERMIDSFRFETSDEKFQPVSGEPIEVVEKFIEADMAGARLGGQLAEEAPDIKKYYTLSSSFPTGFAYEGDIAMAIKKYEIIDEHPSENENFYFVKVKYFCEQGIASGFTEGARNIETGEKISIQEMDNGPELVGFDCDYFYNELVDPSIVNYDFETQTQTIVFELIKDKGLWKLNSPSICPRISEETLKKHLDNKKFF